MRVRTLLFDIGGTVFDWRTALLAALDRHDAFAPLDREAFALACRKGFLDAVGAAAGGKAARQGSDQMLASVINSLLAEAGVAPPHPARSDLHRAWRAMPAWAGASAAIATLRQTYAVLPLTILSWPMAAGSSRANGIAWDGFLCCDIMGIYKPDLRCYARAAEIVDCRPDEIAMVAAHPSDLRAARDLGYRTVYILPQIKDPGEDYADPGLSTEFDFLARDFGELPESLSGR